MTRKQKTAAAAIAFFALRGYASYIPDGLTAADVLGMLPDIGGVELNDDAAEIARKAVQFSAEGSRVSYIIVNTVGDDIQVSLILDTPDVRMRSERDLLVDGGRVLAYVWNATAPDCSELGYIYLRRLADKRIHRRG